VNLHRPKNQNNLSLSKPCEKQVNGKIEIDLFANKIPKRYQLIPPFSQLEHKIGLAMISLPL